MSAPDHKALVRKHLIKGHALKRIALLLLGLLIVPVLALTDVQKETASNFQIQSRRATGLTLSFQLSDFNVAQITQQNELYHKIELPGAQSAPLSGMPDLPIFTTTLAIPATGGVSIQITGTEEQTWEGFNPYPMQDHSIAESTRGFSKSEDFYKSRALYPENDLVYSDPMILRDFRIITLQVNPFIYNAGTKQLTIRQNMEIEVNFTTQPSVNELPGPVQYISPSFDKIYKATIQNYDDYREIMIANTPPRYLIIHGNTTDNNFHTALDNFALWKRQKGADVDVFSTAASEAGSSTSSIQTFIRGRYNNPATRPDYVILVGDTSGSFSVPAYSYSSGASDYPYTHMNTGDILGDVFIGRISVENISQLLVLFNKIYVYERDINIATADWLNRMLLVGSSSGGSGISPKYISKYIKEMALEINPDYTFTEIYPSGFSGNETAINTAITQGVGFYSFRGWIDYDPPAESAINNSYKLLHAINITCGTNNFSGTSEMEQFVRYGTLVAPKGAVTGIGMSTSTTHTTFNNVLHGGIFEGIFVHEMRTMGEALLRGKLYMNDTFGLSSPDNVAKFTHWCNLIGDPTMEVFTGIPGSFQIETDPSIPIGLSLLDVAVSDAQGNSIKGASVVLSQGFDILSRGYTDAQGNCILVLPANMTAGAAQLTISAHDFKPLIHAIPIEHIATLVPAEIVIDDSEYGNDNGIITAGETVKLYFGLLNTGSANMSRITGMLYTESPWVNILQPAVIYPVLVPGIPVNNSNPIVIEIAPDTPHDTLLRLHLTLGDGYTQSFEVSEYIPVESAQMGYISQQLPGNGNGVLDPGENSQFTVSVKNSGAVAAQNLWAELISLNDLLEVSVNLAACGNVNVNSTVATGSFQVLCRPEALPGMVMPMQLRLYNAQGFEQTIDFSITLGIVTEQDPLGPDAYGYVIYDWTDTSYQEAPQYEWIEIATPLGGMGTALNISDVYASNDEGDQVGANSLALVNLPFAFQFYGRLYDQITVCSNGFIALGETGNAEFRNFRLPGAMGPSPMIAAFWDDLATHSGSGIYSYFDRQNRSFIIEWHNLVNGKNGSSPETFQVILYDQNYYYTSLGDGPIKIQYHTFNNVNSQSAERHGNYCSIGIEDHSGTRGLEYTFNNIYPTAAAPLSNGKAIYITNNPSMYDAPILQGSLSDITLHQAESILIPNTQTYFYSAAYLNYSLADNPNAQGIDTAQGFKISFNPSFYGRLDLSLRATDPMGRYVEQDFMAIVQQANGHYEDFDLSAQLPAGWSQNHTGTTTSPWQVVTTDGGGFQAITTATPGHTANERLITASYNLSGFSQTRLRFYMDYMPIGTSSSQLQYSFNGFSWTTIDSYNNAFAGYKTYTLPALNNKPLVKLRWSYVSTINSSGIDNHWIIDDLSICSQVSDTTPPLNITGFQFINHSMGIVHLSWNPSQDDFFSHYEIYLAQHSNVGITDQLYSVAYDPALGFVSTSTAAISGLANGSYWAAIRAVDLSGNASNLSQTVNFVLGAVPAAVQNLSITVLDGALTLSWDPVQTDLTGNPMLIGGYKIYGANTVDFTCDEGSLLGEVNSPEYSAATSEPIRFFKVTAIN